jgi:hypothetical protein
VWDNVQYLICDEWSITADTARLDVSAKSLCSADATLLAGVLHGNKKLVSLNLSHNKLMQWKEFEKSALSLTSTTKYFEHVAGTCVHLNQLIVS